ncbi:MAG TPA: DUF4388 domain-containing protein [Thermoanaerobaculia bacterium]|nr:DUF4388 domain-containing protein [Thermoanaerobaculia bacterium]
MLEGEISEMNLIERLVELWRESFTGAIRFESDAIIKIVYFKTGDILSASTNDRADSVDEILMRAGKVSREHVKQALAKRKENETLGDALLNLGFITRKELTWARRVQVVGVIRSIAAWETGSFTIVADYLPKRDEGTLFPVPQVLVELIVTDQDRPKFERLMDGGAAVFAKGADFDVVYRKLGLNDDAEAIASQIDGQKSVADVATASGGETFNVYKLMHALATLGILTPVARAAAEAAPEFSLEDFAGAGVADAQDMWSEPEPRPAATPAFDFDEAEAIRQPTLEIQIPREPEAEPVVESASAWDEEEPAAPAIEEDAAPKPMPAWDTPPREPAPMPIPVPVEPPAEAEKEQWGFDEAQLETARRAAIPPAAPKKPAAPPKASGGNRHGVVIVLMVVFILGAAGYFGFRYWQDWQKTKTAAPAPAPAPVASATQSAPVPVQPAPAPATDTVTTTQAPLPVVTPATPPPQAQAPKPMTIAAAAPEAPSELREHYDRLARQHASNATGNFTVQIQILCDPANLTKAIGAGGSNVWFVPQTIGGRSCYRVFWGRYDTRDEAQRALAAIPADVRDRSSAVKPVPKG